MPRLSSLSLDPPGLSAVVAADGAAECGDLGMMQTDNLPEGVDPNYVRACIDRPGNDSDILDPSHLSKRACTSGEYDFGCSGGLQLEDLRRWGASTPSARRLASHLVLDC